VDLEQQEYVIEKIQTTEINGGQVLLSLFVMEEVSTAGVLM